MAKILKFPSKSTVIRRDAATIEGGRIVYRPSIASLEFTIKLERIKASLARINKLMEEINNGKLDK